ncbi:MAG: hypothetical protein LBI02_02140 [Opitutaceae bacterium]|jgi:hypothetical protein|nr:hypothetical protein [Opitutaceae bacterium]
MSNTETEMKPETVSAAALGSTALPPVTGSLAKTETEPKRAPSLIPTERFRETGTGTGNGAPHP